MIKHKILQVGCGHMSYAWAQNVRSRSDCQFVGAVDLFPEPAKIFSRKYGDGCPVFTSLNEALKETDANLVFNVTIPEAHEEVTLEAFEGGCVVFSEKPMSNSIHSCKVLIDASEKAGLSFFIMQNRRYLKHLRDMRALIESGVTGMPEFVCAQFFKGAHMPGFREEMASPLIIDMAVHTFDQARYLIGANAVSVWCHEFNPRNSWFAGSSSAVATFKMDNGAVFNYCGSWSPAAHFTSWESNWRVDCIKGSFLWDGDSRPVYEWPNPREMKDVLFANRTHGELPEAYIGREGHDGCLDELFAALNEGRAAETDCYDNIETLKMVFGACESARQGCEIQLDELV